MILYNRADVGEYIGETKQQINEWYKRGQMPKPFGHMYKGAPLWTKEQMDDFYDNIDKYVIDRRKFNKGRAENFEEWWKRNE